MVIGPYVLPNNVFVAPMAGVTDRPFRRLCKALGAGHAVSEMAASNPRLWASEKTARRLNHDGERAPVAVQLAGADAQMLAEAARYNVDRGAQIIDINMGCPAKKVCNVACGSALLKDVSQVARILEAVVAAVNVPVTLKFRTGWDVSNRNAVQIARLAQASGIAALTLHGRTRQCGFTGQAEYQTIRDGQACRHDSGDRQWRYRFAGKGAFSARRNRGRRGDDWPSSTRASVDFPGNRSLPVDRLSSAGAESW